jgi:hypothetical protein
MIITILEQITEKEELPPETLKPDWYVKCSRYSQQNLRVAIECFQSTYYTPTGALAIPSWKIDLFHLCDNVVKDCSTSELDKLFGKYEEYLTSGFGLSSELLLMETLERFLRHPKITDSKKYQLVHEAAIFQKRMITGLNPLVHLKAFCCKSCQIFDTMF